MYCVNVCEADQPFMSGSMRHQKCMTLLPLYLGGCGWVALMISYVFSSSPSPGSTPIVGLMLGFFASAAVFSRQECCSPAADASVLLSLCVCLSLQVAASSKAAVVLSALLSYGKRCTHLSGVRCRYWYRRQIRCLQKQHGFPSYINLPVCHRQLTSAHLGSLHLRQSNRFFCPQSYPVSHR